MKQVREQILELKPEIPNYAWMDLKQEHAFRDSGGTLGLDKFCM